MPKRPALPSSPRPEPLRGVWTALLAVQPMLWEPSQVGGYTLGTCPPGQGPPPHFMPPETCPGPEKCHTRWNESVKVAQMDRQKEPGQVVSL